MKRYVRALIVLIIVAIFAGCVSSRSYFEPESNPLKEHILQGRDSDKVLLIPVTGFISDKRRQEFVRTEPSVVQEVVSHLRKAESDSRVKAVVLKIDSPGGTVTASDILYNEIVAFKKRTGSWVVVTMMNVAASGGYYISLPADHIVAHPTSVTGSIGVLFIQPKFTGLMDKIGVTFDVSKSGDKKDMGSPLRQSTEEEQQIMQDLTAHSLASVSSIWWWSTGSWVAASWRMWRAAVYTSPMRPSDSDSLTVSGISTTPSMRRESLPTFPQQRRWWCTGVPVTLTTICTIRRPYNRAVRAFS
jgi:signal peptide peptidase SppA